MKMWPWDGDAPIKTNRYSHEGHSSGFVRKRDKYLCGTCFEMVGARPSMPDTFDGFGVLARTEMRDVQ